MEKIKRKIHIKNQEGNINSFFLYTIYKNVIFIENSGKIKERKVRYSKC